MNTRSVSVTMSEYSSFRNWELLKSSCLVSDKGFAFIAIIGAVNDVILSNDFKDEEGINVNNLNVDIIWKDKDNRMKRINTIRNVRKINGENRILSCDCVNWEKDCDCEGIVSAEIIITDKKSSCWRNDDTIRWDVI